MLSTDRRSPSESARRSPVRLPRARSCPAGCRVAASVPPISGSVSLRTRGAAEESINHNPLGRSRTDRVPRTGIAGQRQRVTAAAAEIKGGARNGTGLDHPARATEGLECRRRRPALGERRLADEDEAQAGNSSCRMAGQDPAVRRHRQPGRAPRPCRRWGTPHGSPAARSRWRGARAARPASHRPAGVRRAPARRSGAGRHVAGGPAMELDAGDLQTACAETDRQIDRLPSRSRFRRHMTAFRVSGNPNSETAAATSNLGRKPPR